MSSEIRRRPNALAPGASTSTSSTSPTRKKKAGGNGFDFFGLFAPRDDDAAASSARGRGLDVGPSAPPPPELNLRILVEIVSAQRLCPPNPSAADGGAGFVYATMTSGPTFLHRTRTARGRTLSPIWTVLSSSLYLLYVNDEEFEVGPGLTFEVFTSRGALAPFRHGAVTVRPEVIVAADGERLEFELVGDAGAAAAEPTDAEEEGAGESDSKRGILALRFRRATEEDIQFMTAVQPYKPTEGTSVAAAEDAAATMASEAALFAGGPADFTFKQSRPPRGGRRRRGRSTRDPATNKAVAPVEELRVQPCPCPDRVEETTWLSTGDIDSEAMKPSTQWVEAGKGAFGTLHVEIIGCDNLPNLDAGVPGNKTDAFVAMLFEDTLVRTDVIFDCLSPRWMPWSQRAFAFPIKHPTSPLVLGVFDYDEGPINAHDAVGRVVINMSNFECNTVYLLRYTLHSSPNKDDDFGTITFRLRLDYSDEKEALMESFHKPPRFHINVDSAKAHAVLKYLCKGQVHMDQASTKTVSLYARELLSYFEYHLYVIDFMIGVLLWRGHVKVNVPVPKWLISTEERTGEEESEEPKETNGAGSGTENVEALIWFPIHSIALFFAVITTIENPRLIPSTFFLGLAWIMGTIGFEKSHYPYPWEQCKSIGELTSVLVLGRNIQKPVRIDANVGVQEAATIKAINKAKTERFVKAIMAFKTAGLTFYRNYYKTDSESLAIETQEKEWSLFGAQLYYLHLALSYMCLYSRKLIGVLTWKSCSTSYFLMMRCFLMGVASFFIPWGFVLQWSSRIFAWIFLGPWMKLFDIYVVKDYYRTREELEANPEIIEPDVESLFQDAKYSELSKKVRIAAEDAVKLKEMREYRFGKFSSRIPAFDESRFPSVPLPESTAKPYDSSKEQETGYEYLPEEDCTIVFVPGQRLRGTMIHKAEDLHNGDGGEEKKESKEE